MRGIVILSLGNPYYIRMAYQLAYSIKCNEDIPITLVQNNASYLKEEQKKVFDAIIDIPKEIVSDNKFIRAKTYIYDFSPYDETIFLDADMIILNSKKLSNLFEELKGVELTFACRGRTDIKEATDKTSIWGNIKDACNKFDIHKGFWYQLSSEFIYFKKSEKVKSFFDKAKEIYNSDIEHKNFCGGMADEFSFGISCMINDIYPHKERFTPIYWSHAEKRYQRIMDEFINENYYGFSMGGAYASQQQKGFYDNMLKWYQQTNYRIEMFPAQSKARYLESRKSI